MLPSTKLKMSLRLPPTLDAKQAWQDLDRILTSDPPQGARVTLEKVAVGSGWHAPLEAPWLVEAAHTASLTYFDKPCAHMGEGGSIPFMGMLLDMYPKAQFLVTGSAGPGSSDDAYIPPDHEGIDVLNAIRDASSELYSGCVCADKRKGQEPTVMDDGMCKSFGTSFINVNHAYTALLLYAQRRRLNGRLFKLKTICLAGDLGGRGVNFKPHGHGFDPAGACGNGGFADDPQGTDLPGRGYVGASAKFLAPATEVDHPHLVPVLVAEEGDDVLGFLGKGDFVSFEVVVEQEFFVGNAFNLGQLLGFDPFEMRKVKAQAVGFYKRAGLADMIAQNFTQGPMQDMRCGVVALDGLSSLQINVEDALLTGEFDPFRFGFELM